MIWKRHITDVKRSGFDGRCSRCLKHQVGLIRVTFEGLVPVDDKYICDSCWLELGASRNWQFNIFNQQIGAINGK